MLVCVLCLSECPAAAGGVCSGCEVELRAWLQWRARLTHPSPPRTAHRTLRVLLTRLPPPRGPQSHHQPHTNTQGTHLSPPHTAHRTLRVLLTRLPPPRGPQSHHQPHTNTQAVPRSTKKRRVLPIKSSPPCPKCGAQLSTSGGLKRHLVRKHKIHAKEYRKFVPKISCGMCNKQFEQKSRLTRHIREIHTEEQCRPFTCDKCPRKFVRAGRLRAHRVIHFEPTFCCELCEKKFHRKDYLQDHIGAVHLARANTCICPLCGKTLKTAKNLKYHQQYVHTNDRRFKCPECGSKFKTGVYLRYHLKHTHGPRS